MKTFSQYLIENNRLYEFSIKLAGCEFDSSMQEQLKSALDAYAVESIGKAKRLPIQEHLDFPGLGPCECYIVEVAVRYPVVTDQLVQAISEKVKLPARNIIVRTKGQEELLTASIDVKKADDGSVLNNPELDDVKGAQDLVGEKRKESMLKELETRKYEFEATSEPTKSIDMPIGNTSPVGTKQNKIPSPIKGK